MLQSERKRRRPVYRMKIIRFENDAWILFQYFPPRKPTDTRRET